MVEKAERLTVAGICSAVGTLGVVLWLSLGESGLVSFLLGTASLLLFLVLESRMATVRRYYDLVHQGRSDYEQLEALMSA